jgi:type III pantothenate kinase
MLLAIDAGNTQITFGLFRGKKLVASFRATSGPDRTADEFASFVREFAASASVRTAAIDGVVIASVVPALTPELEDMSRRHFRVEPLVISSALDLGIPIRYRDPTSVGADRIVNAIAAIEGHGAPVIVVDLGTATTFDVVGPKGDYLGGVIAPGIRTSSDELFRRGARLARVEIKAPAAVIGRTTEESLQAGIYFGTIGQIDAIVDRIRKELGTKARVIATGGLASLVAKGSTTIEAVEPDLTLEGLRLAVERSSRKGGKAPTGSPSPPRGRARTPKGSSPAGR